MPGRNAGLGGNVQPVRVLPTPHGGNGRLPAGRAFHRLDAATAAGHDLHVNSSYRTYAAQAALYQAYQNGTGKLAAALGLSADIQVTDPATLR